MPGCRAPTARLGALALLLCCCCCWRAAGVAAGSFAAVGLARFLPVPSSISPFSSAEELSCSELLLNAWSQQCSRVAATEHTDVWQCRGAADEAGLLILVPGSTSKQPQQQQQEAASTSSASPPSTGQRVWRLRLVGPDEIVAPPIQYCPPGNLAVAAYRLTSPGQYNAELLLLYEHFTYSDDGGAEPPHTTHTAGADASSVGTARSSWPAQRQRPDPLTLSFTLLVKSVAPASLACGETDSRSGKRKWCPVCGGSLSSSASARAGSASRLGRWVIKAAGEETRALVVQALQRTCLHASPSPSSSSASAGKSPRGAPSALSGCSKQLQSLAQLQQKQKHDDALLAWEPYGCRLRPISLPAAQACQQRLQQQEHRVCFVGDGQMKHLARRVAHILSTTMDVSNSSSSSSSGAVGSFHYFTTDSFTSSSHPISGCSLVFMGAGPEAAAAAAAGGRTARSSGDSSSAASAGDAGSSLASRYAAHLQQAAAQLLAQRRRQQQQQQGQHWVQSGVIWVTTSAYPLQRHPTHHHHQQGGRGGTHEPRSEPYLLLFNKLASGIMTAARIPVLDIYSIARPVADLLVFEGGRRSLGAMVGGAQARLVAGVICPETGGASSSSKGGARGE